MDPKKSSSEIQEEVLNVIRLISLKPSSEVGPETDLFESGTLDSVVLVGLLTKLEESFDLEIPPSEFSPENFSTVGGMTRLIQRLKGR